MTGVDLFRDGLLRVNNVPPPAIEGPTPEEPEPRDPTEPCHICHELAATGRCVQCDRAACASHHWVMYGLCHECLTPQEMQRSRAAREPKRPELGIKWIED